MAAPRRCEKIAIQLTQEYYIKMKTLASLSVVTNTLILSTALSLADSPANEDSSVTDRLSLNANQSANGAIETRAELFREVDKASEKADRTESRKAYDEARAKLLREVIKASEKADEAKNRRAYDEARAKLLREVEKASKKGQQN